VTATVVEQAKTAKVIVYKKKRRKQYQRERGHRQQVTVLKITDIQLEGIQ
jgi:large subunit ribosomal protein L21